jgi:hypothetical protein
MSAVMLVVMPKVFVVVVAILPPLVSATIVPPEISTIQAPISIIGTSFNANLDHETGSVGVTKVGILPKHRL